LTILANGGINRSVAIKKANGKLTYTESSEHSALLQNEAATQQDSQDFSNATV
jgi:hypothetical protein